MKMQKVVMTQNTNEMDSLHIDNVQNCFQCGCCYVESLQSQ